MKIELKKGSYFSYGEKYYVEFTYENEEEKKRMYDVFENGFLNSYGSNSQRAKDGKEYIMPYLADENGNRTTQNTGRIGGTSIPKDLLALFIERFVELDGATVVIGDEEMKGKFNESKFEQLVSGLDLHIELKKGKYFSYGDRYYIEFNYGSEEQQRKIYDLFENGLIPSYGSNSSWAKDGKEYIMPYLADENGNMTTHNTGRIGGVSIPKELLPAFLKRFMELEAATIKVGNEEMKGKFDEQEFEKMVSKLNITQKR